MAKDTIISNLKVESYIKRQSGEGGYRFFWKRKKAQSIELRGVPIERMNGYSLILQDLEKVANWADMGIKQHPSHIDVEKGEERKYFFNEGRERADLIKGLFVAALTFYGKAFSRADGRRVKLEKKHLDPDFHNLHDFYMAYRHNFAAHSGASKLENATSSLVLVGKKKSGFKPLIYTGKIQPDNAIMLDGERNFVDLANNAKYVAEENYNKLHDRIMKKHILPLGPEFWEKIAKTRNSYTIEGK